jgi:hypothetical protein
MTSDALTDLLQLSSAAVAISFVDSVANEILAGKTDLSYT